MIPPLPTELLWAIQPDWLNSILPALSEARGPMPGRPSRQEIQREGRAAVIDIVGVLEKSPSRLSYLFGGSSYSEISRLVNQAARDPAVNEIILRVYSPGGSVAGCDDAATDIRNAGKLKPTTAYIEDQATSAAYYLASQCRVLIANPTAVVGSIGVLLVIRDWSRLFERAGIMTRVIKSGRWKGIGIVGAPLTDEEIDRLKRDIVEPHAAAFQAAIAKGRGKKLRQLDDIFDASLFVGPRAIEVGLVDRIGRLADRAAEFQRREETPPSFYALLKQNLAAGFSMEQAKRAAEQAIRNHERLNNG